MVRCSWGPFIGHFTAMAIQEPGRIGRPSSRAAPEVAPNGDHLPGARRYVEGVQLGSAQGPTIEFEVLGYEFPAASRTDSWDANWLNIAAQIRLEDGRGWEFTHPCLTTFEAAQLGPWLRDLSEIENQGEPRSPAVTNPGDRLFFTEPLLAFEAETTSDGGLAIRILLDLEARPPWEPWEEWTGENQFVLRIPVNRQELHVAARQWAEELAPFPQR